jgi:hypothetical protein
LALRSYAAVETAKNRLSRDFRQRSIFDFCNTIRQERSFHRYRLIATDHCRHLVRTVVGSCIDHGRVPHARRARQRHPQRSRRDDLRTIVRDRDHASVKPRAPFAANARPYPSLLAIGDTGVRLSFLRPSRLLPVDRRFRHFARFHRNLLQAIDKPSAGGPRR